MRQRRTPHGLRTFGAVRCADGWGAARFLLALADGEARGPVARRLARELRARASGDRAFVRAAFEFVRARVRFERERGEVFASLAYTLASGVGDCDDHARALYALLAAGGVPVRLAFMFRRGDRGPRHVVVQAWDGGAWVWLETTIAAHMGEHPIAAGRRLGILGDRSDVAASEVRTMSAKDLPPVPSGVRLLSTKDQLAKDADGLARLGFLADAGAPSTALDRAFRAGVLAFQEARGLYPDGLIGPVTRAAIGEALQPDGPRLSAHLSDGFLAGVKRMARRLGTFGSTATAEDFLAVWLAESGLRPEAGGGGWPAVGLHQILVRGLPDVGWRGTAEAYRALSAEEQLPFVERWYVNRGPLLAHVSDARSLYLCNFLPALLPGGAAPDRVLLRAVPSGAGRFNGLDAATEARFYRDNRGLDAEGKGYITAGDLERAIERAQRGRAALWREVVGRLGGVEGGGIALYGAGAVALVLGLGGALAAHVAGA